MNPTTNGNALSEFLKEMVSGNVLENDVASEANELPTHELQEEAVEIFRDHKKVMRLVVQELRSHPLDPRPAIAGDDIKVAAPHGRIGTALHSMEKFAAWDLLGDVEEWMSVKVPPYRYVRRVFSWACTAFSVETVLAILISVAMLYGGYLAVSAGVKWACHHLSSPSLSFPAVTGGESTKQHDGSPTGTLGDDVKGVAPFQITNPVYGEGNKLELHWPSQGAGYTYRVFAKCHPEESSEGLFPLDDHSISSNGAWVNMFYKENCQTPQIQVMAILPSGAAGPMTDPVVFRLSALNNAQTVEPIAMEASSTQSQTAAIQKVGQPKQRVTETTAKGGPIKGNHSPPSQTSRLTGNPAVAAPSAQNASTNKPVSSSNKPGFFSAVLAHSDGVVSSAFGNNLITQGVLGAKNIATDVAASKVSSPESKVQGQDNSTDLLSPGPTGLTWRHDKGRSLYVSWQDLGATYHYNLYASYANDPPAFDRDGYLLRQASGVWTPPSKGPQVYLMYVTAVNDQGQESAPSERILVDLR